MAEPAYLKLAGDKLEAWLTARLAKRLAKDANKLEEWRRLLSDLRSLKDIILTNRASLDQPSHAGIDLNHFIEALNEARPQIIAKWQCLDHEQQSLCEQQDNEAVEWRGALFISIPYEDLPLELLRQFVVSTQGFPAADESILANIDALQIRFSEVDGGGSSQPESRAAAAPVRVALPHSPVRVAPPPPHTGAGVAPSTLPTPTVGDVYRELSSHLIPRLWLGDGWHNVKKTTAPPSDEPSRRGTTSSIHYGTLRGKQVVLKEFKLHHPRLSKHELIVIFRNEARILAQAGVRCREGVVQLHGYIINGAGSSGDLDSCSLVMPQLESLVETMKPPHPPLSESCRVSILLDIAHALDVLHYSSTSGSDRPAAVAAEASQLLGGDGPIIHCDIKPENVLLQRCSDRSDEAPFRAVLADFGVSHCMGDRRECDTEDNHSIYMTTHTGRFGLTRGFADDQLTSFFDRCCSGTGGPCTESDVYSFGCTAKCVLLLWPVVNDAYPLYVLEEKWKESPAASLWNDAPSWATCPLRALIDGCVHGNRTKRPSMRVVVEKLTDILRNVQAAEAAARGPSNSGETV